MTGVKSTLARGLCQPNRISRVAPAVSSKFLRYSVQASRHTAPVSPYAIQGYCPVCDEEGQIYSGRFFCSPTQADLDRIYRTEAEWVRRRDGDLDGCWPQDEIPFTYMTHQANFHYLNKGIHIGRRCLTPDSFWSPLVASQSNKSKCMRFARKAPSVWASAKLSSQSMHVRILA